MNFWRRSLLLLVLAYDHTVDAQIQLMDTAAAEFRPARIVGGDPAAEGKYPYFCITSPGALCGCSLIYPDVIITAAHCRGNLGNTNIYLGLTKADRTDTMEVIMAGDELVHPNFNSVSLDNDIMLVQLTERSTLPTLTWNSDANDPKTNELLTAIGMGKTSSNGPRAEMLLEVDVAVVSNADCLQTYSGITDNMFCAGGEPGKDSCFGDSGSPILNSDGRMVGVVSWGPTGGCGLDGFPGVYARTSRAQEFIRNGICELSSTPPTYCFEEEVEEPSSVTPPAAPIPSTEINDSCFRSIRLEKNTVVTGSTWDTSPNQGIGICGHDVDTGTEFHNVWYEVRGNGAVMEVDTCGYDSQLILYEDSIGSCSGLTCGIGSRGGCESGAGSRLKWQSVFGTVYRVRVQTVWPMEFSLSLTVLLGPTNPVCGVATKITLNAAVDGSTVGGAWIPAPIASSCGVDDARTPGAWYRVEGIGSSTLRASVSDANFAAKVSVYQGSSCQSLECLALPSSGDSSNTAATFPSTDGTVYWVAVHGEQGAAGDFAITVTEEYPPMLRPTSTPVRPIIAWGTDPKQPETEPEPQPVPQPAPQPQPEPEPPLISWSPFEINWDSLFNWAW